MSDANQGLFGGERLPEHSSRQPAAPRGPAQRAVKDQIGVDDVRRQLGDGGLNRLIEAKQADDGNARVNAG
eukprot:4268600-Prymnesium_polylepis.1